MKNKPNIGLFIFKFSFFFLFSPTRVYYSLFYSKKSTRQTKLYNKKPGTDTW